MNHEKPRPPGPVKIGGAAALPPPYLTMSGHQDCLGKQSSSGSHDEVCLPASKPSACTDQAWQELSNVFVGSQCTNLRSMLGGASSLPPPYLSIEGHGKCLQTYQGSSHSEKCMPRTRPVGCDFRAWRKLLEVFEGIGCPVRLGGSTSALPPAYLSVSGHQDCLSSHQPRDASHTEKCIPQSQPGNCLDAAWTELQNVFEGIVCPAVKRTLVGGESSLPPKYLFVEGHQDAETLKTRAADLLRRFQ